MGCPLLLHTALCQAVVSLLGFRRQNFSGLFPSQTAILSSSCGLRPPFWSNINNEIEDIESLTSTAVEGPCIRALICPDLFCVLPVFICWKRPDAAPALQHGCPEGGTGGRCLLCPSKHKRLLCFSFDGPCSALRSLRSCAYCPNSDNPAES